MKYQRDQNGFRSLAIGWFYIRYLLSGNPKYLLKTSDLCRAAGMLKISLRLAKQGLIAHDDKFEFSFNLVIATALQYQERYDESNILFDKLLSRDVSNLKMSYAYQHYGKSCVEQYEFEKAAELLSKAANYRKNNPDLLASTTRAISGIDGVREV